MSRRMNLKRNRKTRGGFFDAASYLLQKGVSTFQVPAVSAYGNPNGIVSPFPYVQS